MTTEMRVSLAALAASSGTLANSQRAQIGQWTVDDRSPRDRAARHVTFDPATSCIAPAPERVPIAVDETAQTGRFLRPSRGTGRADRTFARGTPIGIVIGGDAPGLGVVVVSGVSG